MVLQDRTSIMVVDTQEMIVGPFSEPSGQYLPPGLVQMRVSLAGSLLAVSFFRLIDTS